MHEPISYEGISTSTHYQMWQTKHIQSTKFQTSEQGNAAFMGPQIQRILKDKVLTNSNKEWEYS